MALERNRSRLTGAVARATECRRASREHLVLDGRPNRRITTGTEAYSIRRLRPADCSGAPVANHSNARLIRAPGLDRCAVCPIVADIRIESPKLLSAGSSEPDRRGQIAPVACDSKRNPHGRK